MGLIANDTNVDQIKTICIYPERALEEAHSSAHVNSKVSGGEIGANGGISGTPVSSGS